jgi:hypothetical protein
MAMKSIWIAVASVLATFDIRYSVDDSGAPIIPTGEYECPAGVRSVPCSMCELSLCDSLKLSKTIQV